jgi:hypothetical protein
MTDYQRTPTPVTRRVGRPMLAVAAGLFGVSALFAGLTAAGTYWLDSQLPPAATSDTASTRVEVAVPEVYELANIALALSDFTQTYRHTVFRKGPYYAEVMAHFGPYRSHRLIQRMNGDIRGQAGWRGFYSFRENAVSYRFEGDRITLGDAFPTPIWRPNVFADYLSDLEDFARVSGFRHFYEAHREWYQGRVASYRARVPVDSMLRWLEARFPSRYGRNRVVFSPLIYGSHSTQRFSDAGGQTIMFIAGPDVANDTLPRSIQNAQLARILFTEIDHNYVNPVSDRYSDRISQVFSDTRAWNHDTQAGMYQSPYATFNEYMTWAVFLLYARDTYDSVTYGAVRRDVVAMMEGPRGFVRFGTFADRILRITPRDASSFSADAMYREVLR